MKNEEINFENLNEAAYLFNLEYNSNDFNIEVFQEELQKSFEDFFKDDLIHLYFAFKKIELCEENKELNDIMEGFIDAISEMHSFVFYYKFFEEYSNEKHEFIYEKLINSNYANYNSYIRMFIDKNKLIIIEFDEEHHDTIDIEKVTEIDLENYKIKNVEKAFFDSE